MKPKLCLYECTGISISAVNLFISYRRGPRRVRQRTKVLDETEGEDDGRDTEGINLLSFSFSMSVSLLPVYQSVK